MDCMSVIWHVGHSLLYLLVMLVYSVSAFKCQVEADIMFDNYEWDFEALSTTTANLDGNIKNDYLLYWNLDEPVSVESAGYSCQKAFSCIENVTSGYFIPSGSVPICTALFGDEMLPPEYGTRMTFQTSITNHTDFSSDTSTLISATTYIDMVCPSRSLTSVVQEYIPDISDPVYLDYIISSAQYKNYVPGLSEIVLKDDKTDPTIDDPTIDYDVHLVLYSYSACPYHTKKTAKELVILLVILVVVIIYLVPIMIIKRYIFLLHGGEIYPNYNFWCLFKRCMKMGFKIIIKPVIKIISFIKVGKMARMDAQKEKINQLKQANPYINCDIPSPFSVQRTLAVPYGMPTDATGNYNADELDNISSSEKLSSTKADEDKEKHKIASFKEMWQTAMMLMQTQSDKALLPDISTTTVRDKSLSQLFFTSFVDIQFKYSQITRLKITKIPKNPKHKGYLEAKIINNQRVDKLRYLFVGEDDGIEEDDGVEYSPEGVRGGRAQASNPSQSI